MTFKGILLCGFLVLAAVVALTSAIIAAAPAIAVVVIIGAIGLVLYWTDYPSDKNKPP